MSACSECDLSGKPCAKCGHEQFEVPENVGTLTPARLSLVPQHFPQPQLDDLEGVTMSEPEVVSIVSPTGHAQFNNQIVIKVASAVVGAASLVLPFLPEHNTIAKTICLGIIGFGSMLGIVSPGARK